MWETNTKRASRTLKYGLMWADVTEEAKINFELVLLEEREKEERDRKTGLGQSSWRSSYLTDEYRMSIIP